MNQPTDASGSDVLLATMLRTHPSAFDSILKFYTEQFKYSASQRISTIQYFVAAFAFLTGGYTTLVTAKIDQANADTAAGARLVVAMTAYFLTLAFARLDIRNKQIVELDEKPLIRLQAAIGLALQDNDPLWQTFDLRNAEAQCLTTYGRVVPLIYLVAAIVSVAAFVAALGVFKGHDAPLPMQLVLAAVLILFGWSCIVGRLPKR